MSEPLASAMTTPPPELPDGSKRAGSPLLQKVWVWEGLILLILLLVFCGITLMVIKLTFPSGITLNDLMTQSTGLPKLGNIEQTVEGVDDKYLNGNALPFTAEVVWLMNDVRHRVSGDIAWRRTRVGGMLSDNDALQTFRKSRARLLFGDGNFLEVNENSLIIVNGAWLYKRARFPIREYMLAIEGTFEGKIVRNPDSEVHFKIMLDDELVTIRPAKSESREVKFKAIKSEDGAFSILVYQGNAEVQVGNQIQLVNENHAFTINAEDINISPIVLPPPPVLNAPEDDLSVYFRERSPSVNFTWEGVETDREYQFVLASDEEFKEILLDEEVAGDSFDGHNLKQGQYYWRVATLVGKLPGRASEVRKIRFIEDNVAPVLEIEAVPQLVYESSLWVKGQVEPGSKVAMSDKRVSVESNGSFKHKVNLKPGVNVIVIEAFDPAGNVQYKTFRVIGKF